MTDTNPPQERGPKASDKYAFENLPVAWQLMWATEELRKREGPWFLLRPKAEVDGAIEDLLHKHMKPLSPMPPGETIGEGARRIGYYRFGRDILRAAIHDALDY
jgi:hypothetical protein